jgi:hypothetical protein
VGVNVYAGRGPESAYTQGYPDGDLRPEVPYPGGRGTPDSEARIFSLCQPRGPHNLAKLRRVFLKRLE